MNPSNDDGERNFKHSRYATLALTSLISTIILVMVGSIVRVTGYGLGCPDWPLCYGRAVPPIDIAAWVEFGHRLFGGIVSIQIAAFTWLTYRNYKTEKWLWPPALAASVLLIIQIILGGLHVLNELPKWTGLVHTGVATAIVGLLALLVAVTQPRLLMQSERVTQFFEVRTMKVWTLLGATSAYLLILSGSLVTRTVASLVCPSFPLCGLENVPDSLLNLVIIQMTHRIIALIVLIIASYLIYLILKKAKGESVLQTLSYALIILLLVQVGLGISNVLLGLPLWSRILHLGTATTIWAVFVILAVLFQQPRVSTYSETVPDSGSVTNKANS